MLLSELKAGLNAYLATTPPAVKTRTLAEVIAFNAASSRELSLFGQELFEKAETSVGLDDPAYLKARADSLQAAGPDGIDRLIVGHQLDALIAPSYGPAWRIDVGAGDHGWGPRLAPAGHRRLSAPDPCRWARCAGCRSEAVVSRAGLERGGAALALGHAYERSPPRRAGRRPYARLAGRRRRRRRRQRSARLSRC